MHLERMYLLLQRLKRNRNFSRPAFAGLKAGTRPYVEVWAPAMCHAHPAGQCPLGHSSHLLSDENATCACCVLVLTAWWQLQPAKQEALRESCKQHGPAARIGP